MCTTDQEKPRKNEDGAKIIMVKKIAVMQQCSSSTDKVQLLTRDVVWQT